MNPSDSLGLGGNSAEATRVVWIVAVALGSALIAVLCVLYHRARAQLELEEAERLIRERFGDD